MKKKEMPSVPEAELAVLEVLWQSGETSIRHLRDTLYPDGGSSKFATVQKLLTRLESKGLVGRRRDEPNWLFQPLIGREDLIGGELRRVASRLGGASMAPLLTYLVETGELTSKERAHLRKLLDDAPETETRARPTRSPKGDKSP